METSQSSGQDSASINRPEEAWGGTGSWQSQEVKCPAWDPLEGRVHTVWTSAPVTTMVPGLLGGTPVSWPRRAVAGEINSLPQEVRRSEPSRSEPLPPKIRARPEGHIPYPNLFLNLSSDQGWGRDCLPQPRGKELLLLLGTPNEC